MKRWSNLTVKDLYKGIVHKLSLEEKKRKRAREPIFWYLLDGNRTLRIPMPNRHGGSGSISKGYMTQIRKALKLSTREFEELVDCALKAEGFEAKIRDRVDN